MSEKIIRIEPLGFPWETQDPFLFCAYHKDQFPAGNGNMGAKSTDLIGRNIGQDFVVKNGWRMYHGQTIPGFPYHPHRGFETITINKEGAVDHSDSLGAAGRFMAGDVQWMTAGKGVQHSEMFPLLNDDKPNPLEIFQVWLNLPKKSKFVEPHFKMLWREEIPRHAVSDGNGKMTLIDVIAGSIFEVTAPNPTPDSWAADPNHGVRVLTIKMDVDASWTLPSTGALVNRSAYFYRGDFITVDQFKIENEHHLKLHADAEIEFVNNGSEEAYLLILEGQPIGEPVAQYGPFVMNTQQEIQEALHDYQATQFGGWPWKVREKVHAANRGRFALHANGVEEVKE